MKTLIEWFKRHKKFGTTLVAVLLTISVTAALAPSILSTNNTGGGISETTQDTSDLDDTSDSDVTTSDDDSNDGDDVKATASGYWSSYATSFTIRSDTTNEISTAEEFAYFATCVNSGNTFSGYVFQLTADIDLSAHYWNPIGCVNSYGQLYAFSGEFDGNGCVISGLTTYNDGTSYKGLFGRVTGESASSYASIHDLSIEDSDVSGSNGVGAVVGVVVEYAYVYNCSNSGNVSGNYSVGGIVGDLGVNATIYNCFNTGNVTATEGGNAGGIVGDVYECSVYSCFNTAEVNGYYHVGGIVGYSRYSYIYNCYNIGAVSGTNYWVGGIAGEASNSTRINNCYNVSDVSGLSYVGGIVGGSDSNVYKTSHLLYIYNCFSLGDITASSSSAGGIWGFGNRTYVIPSYCYYYGVITSGSSTSQSTASTEYIYYSDLSFSAQKESWFTDESYWNDEYPWNFDYIWEISSGYPTFIEKTIRTRVLVYNSNLSNFGSSDTTIKESVINDSPFTTLSSDTFTFVETGYTIVGWSTVKVDGVVITCNGDDFGASFFGNSNTYLYCDTSYVYSQAAGDNLYAVWGCCSYNLTYNSNFSVLDGIDTTTTQSVYHGYTFTTLENSVFSIDGYKIIGWSTTQTTTVATYCSVQTSGTYFTGVSDTFWGCNTSYYYEYDDDYILYAVWAYDVQYDDDGDYWYIENGYCAQSVCDEPSGVSETGTSYSFALSSSMKAGVVMYSDGTDEYAYVTISGDGVGEIASAWFLVEPIRWIVAYGEEEPTSYDVAVSAYVLTCGSVSSSAAGSDWDWTESTLLDLVADLEDETSFTIASDVSWSYDAFVSTVGQSFVSDDASTATSVVSVASVAEIDALGGTYKAQSSDFVAFLLSGGTTTSGYVVDYWTRDLAYELDSSTYYGGKFGASSYGGYYNSGVYVGADGLISNAWLSETMGARLSVTLG